MTSHRPPSDGDSSRELGIPRACRQIGARIASVRQARQLSVDDVAARLILSRAQVNGLEGGDPSAFYSSAYFLRGLRKYMAFSGIPEDVLDLAQAEDDQGEDPEDLRMTLAVSSPVDRPRSRLTHIPGRWPTVAGAGAVVLVAAAAVARLGPLFPAGVPPDTLQLAAVAPIPAQPLHLPVEAPTPVSAIPASEPEDQDARVRLSVGKATWVFVRFPDNRVTERRLAPGEAFEVGPLPVYLAIGTADSVELRVEDRPVPLEPYIRNGQVRLTRPELAALTAPGTPR